MVSKKGFSIQARDEHILKFSTLLAQAIGDKALPSLPGFEYGQSPYFASLSTVLPQVRALQGTKSKFETEAEQDAAIVSFFLNMSWLTRLILNNELYLLPNMAEKERQLAIQQELLDAANRELQALLNGQLASEKSLREKLIDELQALMNLLSLLNAGLVNNSGLGLWLQLQDQYAYLDMLHIAKNADHCQHYLQSMDELLATTLATEPLDVDERLRLQEARTAIGDLAGRYQQLQAQQNACIDGSGALNPQAYQAYRQQAQALTQQVQVLRGQMNSMAQQLKPRHAAFADKVQAIDHQLTSRLAATNREFGALKEALAKQLAQVAPAKGEMANLIADLGKKIERFAKHGGNEFSILGEALLHQSRMIQTGSDPHVMRHALKECATNIERFLTQSSTSELAKQPKFSDLLNQLRQIQSLMTSNNQPAPFSPALAQTIQTVAQYTTSADTSPSLSSSAKAHSKLSQITRAAPTPISHSQSSTGLPEKARPEPTKAVTSTPLSEEPSTASATVVSMAEEKTQECKQAPHGVTEQEKLKQQLAEIKVRPQEASPLLNVSEEAVTEIEHLYEKLQELMDDPELCDLPSDYVSRLLTQAEHIYQQAQQAGQADPEALQQLRNLINEGKVMFSDSEDINDIEETIKQVELALETSLQLRISM